MKSYRSHKVVEAGVIVEIEPGRVKVGHEWIDVPANIFARGEPTLGEDYLVLYADGYISWSPRKAFEDSYDEVGP